MFPAVYLQHFQLKTPFFFFFLLLVPRRPYCSRRSARRGRPLAERLVRARLEAGRDAGGEEGAPRPCLMVALDPGMRLVDLRVDDDPEPVAALRAPWDNYAPWAEELPRPRARPRRGQGVPRAGPWWRSAGMRTAFPQRASHRAPCLDPARRRRASGCPDLAARGRRRAPRAGRPRVPAVPQERRDRARRLRASPLARRARLRGGAGRYPRQRVDSEGVLLDEYHPQEQLDCLEVLRWIAAQSWCTGTIGMMGISWVGSTACRWRRTGRRS